VGRHEPWRDGLGCLLQQQHGNNTTATAYRGTVSHTQEKVAAFLAAADKLFTARGVGVL
jgi:hypothetical protein